MAANEQAALVVRLEAKFDKLEKQLKQVGVLADGAVKDIEDKFARANPQIGGGLVDMFAKGTFAGNLLTKVFDLLITKLGEVATKFVDVQKASELTGTALTDVAAAAIALGSPEGFGKAFSSVATMLDRAKRGEINDLSKQFEAMGIAITQSMTPLEAWIIAVERIQTAANPIRAKERADAFKIPDDVLASINAATAAGGSYADQLEAMREKTKALEKVTEDTTEKIMTGLEKAGRVAYGAFKLYADGLDILLGKKVQLDGYTESLVRMLQAAGGGPPINIPLSGPLGNIPKGTTKDVDISTKPAAAAEKREQVSALQRLVIEQEKQTNLAKSELQLIDATNTARAVGRAQVEATAAAQKDVERGLKIAPALIEERTKKIRENAAAEAEYLQKIREVNDAVSTTKNVMSDALKTFVSALQEGKTAADAMRDSLKRVADLLLDKSINLALNMLVAGNTTGTGIGGPLGAGIAGLFPQRQHGGPVSAGQSYIVGENGPELVRFGRNGMVIPNAAVGSSGGGVSVQIINNGAQVSQSSKRRSDGGTDLRVVIDAAVSDLASTPGTSTNRALRMGSSPLIRRS